MNGDWSGRTALITGASRGIGAATARAFARKGARRLVLHYHRNREGVEEVLADARRAGTEADAVQADLGDASEIHRFLKELKSLDLSCDILVNNAGSLVKRAKLSEFTEEVYDRVMNLNVKSAWFITQALAPRMIERGSGFIVNVSSIAARNGGGPGSTIYAGAKAAISAITKGLAKELAPHGIQVNAVSPGTVDNYFHQQFSSRETLEAVARTTPAGRLGTNEEIADAIVFLCSPESRYIHGQTIEINGGGYMI